MSIDDYNFSAGHDPEFNGDADREESPNADLNSLDPLFGWHDCLPSIEDDGSDPFASWPSYTPPADELPSFRFVCADGTTRAFALAPCDVEGGRRIARRVQEEEASK